MARMSSLFAADTRMWRAMPEGSGETPALDVQPSSLYRVYERFVIPIGCDTLSPAEAAREILDTHLLRLVAERRTSRSEHALTRLQRYVLMTVKRRGHLGVSELVDLLEVGPTTASQFITTLEERGWLHRELDARDRRRHVITLTDTGQAALSEALRRDRERLEFWLAQLTGEERVQIVRLTHRVVEIVAAAVPPDGSPDA